MAATQAIQGRRLRDQVYDLVRADMKAGYFQPHQRFFEVELAEKYGVSRTPVREALFQLVREGLLINVERGYTLPIDTRKSLADRLEVHLLLDPQVAHHAANQATADQVKTLSKAYDRMTRAHEAGKHANYTEASHEFRVAVRSMCDNEPLRRCAMLIEDQFLTARNELFRNAAHRELDLRFNDRILKAIKAKDAAEAETATREYMLTVRDLNLAPSSEAETNTPAAKPPGRRRRSAIG